MTLLDDYSIRVAGADLQNCLWLHQGTEHPAEIADEGEPYTGPACVPVAARRRLSAEEIRRIQSKWHWPSPSCIATFRVHEDVLDEIKSSKIRDFDGHPTEQHLHLGSMLWARLCETSPLSNLGPVHCLGISTRPSGLRTSTFDPSDGLRIGLHLDSWDRMSLRHRHLARVRLCINLGAGHRSLLFVPHDIRTVSEALAGVAGVHTANIGERFCSRFPTAPVLELEIPPGYAYLAPTENLVHDGHSEKSPEPDLTIAWLGFIHYSGEF